MANDIKKKVSALDKINQIEVSITFDPPWSPDMMTENARKTLGFETINESDNNQKIKTEWE